MENVLVLGYGRLGKELIKQTGWDYLSVENNSKFDFCNPDTYISYINSYKTIINCIAFTGTYIQEKGKLLETNFKAVCKLVNLCNDYNRKLIQLSTDYIYSKSLSNASEEDVPVSANTWYAYSKLLADGYVQCFAENYLLIRTSFKSNPFEYQRAPVNQIGNFDYVEVIAKLIIQLIEKDAQGIYNVGTELKNVYDLAVKTRPNVIMVKGETINKDMPLDISMNLNKMKKFLGEKID